MGSNYFGEANLGNQRSGGSSSSSSSPSRKGKKTKDSDKPKQPQRGLGVAQLEKIRLHSQLGAYNIIPSLQTPQNFPIINSSTNKEDIRLQTPYSSSSFSYTSLSSSPYSIHGVQSKMMGIGDKEGPNNIRYGETQPITNPRFTAGNSVVDAQNYQQPPFTRRLLDLNVEESMGKKIKKSRSGSGSEDSGGSSGNQELDLELRLSI